MPKLNITSSQKSRAWLHAFAAPASTVAAWIITDVASHHPANTDEARAIARHPPFNDGFTPSTTNELTLRITPDVKECIRAMATVEHASLSSVVDWIIRVLIPYDFGTIDTHVINTIDGPIRGESVRDTTRKVIHDE